MYNNEVNNTILKMSAHDKHVEIKMPWDANVDQLLEAFYGACITLTFQPVSIIEAMSQFAEERMGSFKCSVDAVNPD